MSCTLVGKNMAGLKWRVSGNFAIFLPADIFTRHNKTRRVKKMDSDSAGFIMAGFIMAKWDR